MRWKVALLLALALAQMAGHVLGLGWLEGLAAATCASPAPRVFAAVKGLETFSTRFFLEWRAVDGRERSIAITPEIAAKLRGPYNRRNVYGAVLAYGPVLASDAHAKPMLEAALRYALCPPSRLLLEIGEDPARVEGAPRLRYEPLRPDALRGLPVLLEASCK